jgi:hypothetical protein
VVSLVVSFFVSAAIGLLVRDWRWAALYASLVIVLFFSYGHAYNLVKGVELWNLNVGRHRFLVVLWIGLLIFGWRSISMARVRARNPESANRMLNFISVVLIVVPLYAVLPFAFQVRDLEEPLDSENSGELSLGTGPNDQLPDIYYIILDGYPRGDVLDQEFGFDNSYFLDELEQLGFSIAESSQSNYAQTELSLASSLNMDYLQNLSDEFVPESDDRSDLWRLIRHSDVRRSLEDIGYSTVAYETGFYWTQLSDADYYFTRHDSSVNRLTLSGMNAFEALFFQTTGGKVVVDALAIYSKLVGEEVVGYSSKHRERILYVLNTLDDIWSIEGPKFIFAHIVTPHPPFVFGPNGENLAQASTFTLRDDQLSDEEYVEAYRDQVAYINSQIAPILEQIITNSNPPPIIVVQADHGPGRLGQRMTILNALYLPGVALHQADTASPVNTFRLIFNQYFGAELDILDDVSYISGYSAPYDFEIVPNPDAR